MEKKEKDFLEELLKNKEDLDKAIDQAIGNINFLQGQKAYNQSLIEKFNKEDIKK